MTLERIVQFRTMHNRFMQMLGIRLVEIDEGYARCEMPIKEEYNNPNDSVHGGVIFTLADCVSGYAASTHGMRCTTLDSTISYLKPALNAKMLYGEAREVKYGKTVLVYDVSVTDDQDRLIARSTFTYYNLGVPIPETEEDTDNLKEKRRAFLEDTARDQQ